MKPNVKASLDALLGMAEDAEEEGLVDRSQLLRICHETLSNELLGLVNVLAELLDSDDEEGAISTAGDDLLRSAVQDEQAGDLVRRQAAAVLRARECLHPWLPVTAKEGT